MNYRRDLIWSLTGGRLSDDPTLDNLCRSWVDFCARKSICPSDNGPYYDSWCEAAIEEVCLIAAEYLDG